MLVVFYEGVIAKGGEEEFPIDWDYTIVVKVNSYDSPGLIKYGRETLLPLAYISFVLFLTC